MFLLFSYFFVEVQLTACICFKVIFEVHVTCFVEFIYIFYNCSFNQACLFMLGVFPAKIPNLKGPSPFTNEVRNNTVWTVPQLSIMIIYNCTWSILIQ